MVVGCCKPTLNRHRAYQLQDTIVQRVEEVKMKKLFAILALTLLLLPAVAFAQPPAGCTWNGDPCMRYGFSGTTKPGIDYETLAPGAMLIYELGPQNAHSGWVPPAGLTCNTALGIQDTFCLGASSAKGWTLTSSDPGIMVPFALGSGSVYWSDFRITAPCDAEIGDVDTVVVVMYYAKGVPPNVTCAPECGDCVNPNYRSYVPMYNADTLIITVVAAPPALGVLQDTLTLVDRGQTQAFIPFTICNQDDCAPPTLYSYNIKSKGVAGRISAINQSGSATVSGGACKDVYGIIDAGIAFACDYDTLTIIVWTPAPVIYDTCVQVIHIIEPEPVPLFTVPVVTILVLALILAAAVFMRRRAVSRA
jgi:hypothetical protein